MDQLRLDVEEEAVVGVRDDVVEAHAVARLEVDVRHPDERDPVPAVGAHRPAAAPADPWRRLAAGQVAGEDARLHEGHALGGDALVVPAERPQAAVRRRVGDEVDEVRSVAEALVELVGRQEARAGVGSLGTEHPVELGRVSAALVDLEVELRGMEDDRASAGRQGGRAQELDGLLGEGPGARCEVEPTDVLVAGGAVAAARLGVGAPLELVAAGGVDLEVRHRRG